jgi:gamma-glutamylcysteine synthetase
MEKVLANRNRQIGTEWEMFFVRRGFFESDETKSFTRSDCQKVYEELMSIFTLRGHRPKYIHERIDACDHIVGLDIPKLGVIVPEAGHQFEFSCAVCENVEEIEEANEEAHSAIMLVAERLRHDVVFKGHVSGYAERGQSIWRSRSLEWQRYYNSKRFSDSDRHTLRETQNGTASVQVTLDSGGSDFHEFFQALLLIEPALAFHYANSDRSYVGMREYGKIIPSQVEPIVNVWDARNAREAVSAIVERLLMLEVPFLPDTKRAGKYKAEKLKGNRPPTVKEVMEEGRLSEKMLNNIGGFFYTRPALRNFDKALLEVRGIDSQADPKTITEIASRISTLVYNDVERHQLLRDYSHLTSLDVKRLHMNATSLRKNEASKKVVAGMTMSAFVSDILARSEPVLPIQKTFMLQGRGKSGARNTRSA